MSLMSTWENSMSHIIRVENLIYNYVQEEKEPVTAIDDVTFDVEEGSFVAIIGSNGSGKSTLAKNLNGLYVPSDGKVYVNRWDTEEDEHIWEVRCTCGMVFQNPDNQIVSTIVEDDVAFGPENMGVEPKEIRVRVDNAIEAVGMEGYKRKSTTQLSGGQKQRVAIAGVIAMKPKCIIFDEPTAMLDPKGRKDTMSIIHKLHSEGMTIILITHYMSEASEADKIIVMDEGKIILEGTPEEVFSNRDRIVEAGLEVPMPVELRTRLQNRGIYIPDTIITNQDFTEFILQTEES